MGDGKTEINTNNADAIIVKNASNSSATTFNVKTNGQLYVANSVGVGTLPSTSTFLNVSAGANSTNADLFSLGSTGTPNAILVNYKGITIVNSAAVASGSVFKVKNNNTDIFAIRYDGVAFAREVVVTLSAFPDYVFSKNYNLLNLSDVKKYIEKNHRLPNMPSAEEVKRDGASLGEVQRLTVEKVEELYLYIFQLEERINTLNTRLKSLEKE